MAVESGLEAAEYDLAVTPLRELNAALHVVDGSSPRHWRVLNPRGAHALAVGIDAPIEVEIEGHAGYYCAGMNKEATVRVHGNVGVGVAENIMSGAVIVDGNASQSAGATGRGGLVVIRGSAAARCGISMKGVDIVVQGSVGHMSAFMAQKGCLVVCGDAGEALGDSIYEAHLYVRGIVAGLGSDCVEKEMREEHVAELTGLLERAEVEDCSASEFRRYGSARRLYNFDVDNAGSYLTEFDALGKARDDVERRSASRGWRPGLREGAIFNRDVIHEIQRAAREGIYDIRGFGAKRHGAALRRPALPRRQHVALPARGLPRALRHRRDARRAPREEAAPPRHPDHDRGDELRRAVGAGEGGPRARAPPRRAPPRPPATAA